MSNRVTVFLCLTVFGPTLLHAQAVHTASRIGDLQVGVGYVSAASDYTPSKMGYAGYVTFDPTSHLGGEFVIHQANSTGNDKSYERTYEIGARYFRTYGSAVPYVKLMVGRGVFNYPGQYNPATNSYGEAVANLAYNLYAGGIGCDLKVSRRLNLRADFEYQSWLGFPGTHLNPELLTIGVAYHFPGELKSGRLR